MFLPHMKVYSKKMFITLGKNRNCLGQIESYNLYQIRTSYCNQLCGVTVLRRKWIYLTICEHLITQIFAMQFAWNLESFYNQISAWSKAGIYSTIKEN